MTRVSRITGIPLAITAATLATLTEEVSAQPAPPDLPTAILCYAEADQSWRVGYLSKVDKGGDALYVTADRRLGVTVSAKGVVVAPTNRPPSTDCYGKTLEKLRASGRTIEAPRAK